MGSVLVSLIITALFVLSGGCATEEKERVYNYNTFYATQPKPPEHPSKSRRSQIDIFNKTCELTGRTNDHGREYECHYDE